MVSTINVHRNVTIIIDSNIFIALEELGNLDDSLSIDAARFQRLASDLGFTVAVSAGTISDISRASPERRKLRNQQLTKYLVLDRVPIDENLAIKAGFPLTRSRNDSADLMVLSALASGAANWLLTQDVVFRKRAQKAGFGEAVFSLSAMLEMLTTFLSKPSMVPSVDTVKGYVLNRRARIFESLRADYPEFDEWWVKKVAGDRRDVIVLGSASDPEGIAALKIEGDGPHNLSGKVLKISTYKTSELHQGSKRGELLLYAVIDFARRNACDLIYLEILPSKIPLTNWLPVFGFYTLEGATTDRGEIVMVKELVPDSLLDQIGDLDYNIRYGPGAVRANRMHIVPIKPRYHRRLFPDAEQQIPFFPREEACGNAIRKAYLCHAETRLIEAGDVLLFLRTGKHSEVAAVGVAEDTLSSKIPGEIIAFVGNRTVYSASEINDLCENQEVLAVRFRLDRVLSTPWKRDELLQKKVFVGNVQSIQRIREEGIEWIRQKLAGSS